MSFKGLFNRQVSVHPVNASGTGTRLVFGTATLTGLQCRLIFGGTGEAEIVQGNEYNLLPSHTMQCEDNDELVSGVGIKVTAIRSAAGQWTSVPDGSEFVILGKRESQDRRNKFVVMVLGELTKRTVGA